MIENKELFIEYGRKILQHLNHEFPERSPLSFEDITGEVQPHEDSEDYLRVRIFNDTILALSDFGLVQVVHSSVTMYRLTEKALNDYGIDINKVLFTNGD